MRKWKTDNVQLKGKHQMKMRKFSLEKNWNVSNNLGVSAVQCPVFVISCAFFFFFELLHYKTDLASVPLLLNLLYLEKWLPFKPIDFNFNNFHIAQYSTKIQRKTRCIFDCANIK